MAMIQHEPWRDGYQAELPPKPFEEKPFDPGFEPTEFKVLVLRADAERVTKGGIIIPDAKTDADSRASMKARVISVSPAAFTYVDWPAGYVLPQAGEDVVIGRYTGVDFEGRDGRTYTIVNDREIAGVFR